MSAMISRRGGEGCGIVHSAAKAADSSQRKGNYGALTARNPKFLLAPSGPPLPPRREPRQLKEALFQLPPRNKRYEPVVGPVGLVTLTDE